MNSHLYSPLLHSSHLIADNSSTFSTLFTPKAETLVRPLVSIKHERSPSRPTGTMISEATERFTMSYNIHQEHKHHSGNHTTIIPQMLPSQVPCELFHEFLSPNFHQLQHTDLYWMTNDVTPKEEFISGSELHKGLSLDSSAGAWQVMNVVLDRIHHIWERKPIEKTQGLYK